MTTQTVSNSFSISTPEQIYYLEKYTEKFERHGGVLIFAAVARYFQFKLALPLFMLGTSRLLTGLAVEYLNHRKFEEIAKFQKSVFQFKERYSRLHVTAFVITVITAYIWSPLSCTFGIALGFFSGLIWELEYSKILLNIHSTKKHPPTPLSFYH